MALFCVWTRRACSHYVVLGQPIPTGSRLEAHMARCPECREYWNDLRLLTSDLGRLVHVPHPSPQFAAPIRERVKPTLRTFPWGRLSLAATAACGLACGLAWWRAALWESHSPSDATIAKNFSRTGRGANGGPGANASHPLSGQSIAKEHTKLPAYALLALPGVVQVGLPEGPAALTVKDPAPRLRQPVKWSPVRTVSRFDQIARRSRHGAAVPPSLRGSEATDGLRASGLMYESQGDPGLANVAYQAAYQQHPSEETAFDVGRSAEESGDMEQAMNVYAGLLESADAKARAQKGWNP